MMRKNNNRNNMKHRGGQGGGGRRYHQGGNRNHQNDGQNIARQKHHATQQREKYSNLAREAHNNGDRVDVEYYLQHVEHYSRVLTDIAVIEAERYAHHRDQQAPQGIEGQAEGDTATSGEGDSNAAPVDAAAEENAPITPSHQPRITRQPRRPYQAPAVADNASSDSTSGGDDIPLPGGILPQL